MITFEILNYREKLDKIVRQKNIKKLRAWLTSPTTEIQLYAVDGFYQLQQSGYVISPADKRLIQMIIAKKGNVKYCSGCFIWSKEI